MYKYITPITLGSFEPNEGFIVFNRQCKPRSLWLCCSTERLKLHTKVSFSWRNKAVAFT